MKRTLAAIMASAMMLFALPGCSGGNTPSESTAPNNPPEESSQATEPVTISVGVPTAPPALPVLHMMDAQLLGEDVTIDLNVWNAPEELLAMVQGGEHDMYAFPLTVISTLYNKGLDVRLMNVNTWGVTYFMTTDPDFTTWSDLAGKTVYIPLQSSPPDALTQYFLNEAGLTVDEDVEVVYASTAEVASLLASGQAEYATLIEPQVTSAMKQNSEVRRALSFEEEWQRVTGTDTMIPNAGFGTTQTFIDGNPELTAQFQEAYAESAAKAAIDMAARYGVKLEETTLGGVPAWVLTPANLSSEKADKIIFHIHGGGYILGHGAAGTGEAILMAAHEGYKIVSVDYRMAPEHPYPAAIDDAFKAYRALLEKVPAKNIAVFGTSTGGAMTLILGIQAAEAGVDMPAALISGTPWSDMDKVGDTYYTNEHVDNILVTYDGLIKSAVAAYAGKNDLRDPHISPVYADDKILAKFPPTLMDVKPGWLNEIRIIKNMRVRNLYIRFTP